MAVYYTLVRRPATDVGEMGAYEPGLRFRRPATDVGEMGA